MRLLKNFVSFFLALLVISLLTFILIKLQPGDPAANYLRASHVAINDEALNAAREQLGLNKHIVVQYTDWLVAILKGDLGTSYLKKMSVLELLGKSLLPTFQLGIISFILLSIISFALGLISAIYHGKIIDYLIQILSYIDISIPTFWLGYMLIIIFAVTLKWVPVSGRGGLINYILPAITLITPLIGQTTLLIRKSILEQMNQAHVTNAIIRGVQKRYIITNHLLKNALVTILTVFSANIMALFTGSVLVEEVFSWPGIGKMFTSAVKGGDTPVIQAALLFFGLFAIIINSLTQLVVHYIEPQLRMQKREASYEKE